MNSLLEIIATYKPSGVNTHRTSDQLNESGFVEWLEDHFNEKLFPFQRLDAGTSGVLLIAKSKEAAAKWTEFLSLKKVNKKYLFLTKFNKKSKFVLNQSIRVSSSISKMGGSWHSDSSSPTPNSETEFHLLDNFGDFQLWMARPLTGKTHQIRLHAQSLGISILGDENYGGDSFYRLCLHAYEIEVPELNQQWRAEPPPFFKNLNLLLKPDLCSLLGAIDLREQLILRNYLNSETYRLSHFENENLRVDKFGDQLWFYNYNEKDSISLIDEMFHYYKAHPSWIREMKNRGEKPNESALIPIFNPLPRWIATENNLKYEFRSDQGLSPGLFLDQRENRKWVQDNSIGKKVLNLFSYTCGFSLNAAMGDAKEVVSVDVSATFLDWGKKNFQLNGLDPSSYEFWANDSVEFLKRTLKMKRKFDLIICDPPSFGRSKKGVFNIEKDLDNMVEMIFSLLENNGILLISTNYEKWSIEQFRKKVFQKLPKGFVIEQEHPPYPLDFIEPKNSILKTIIFQKIQNRG